MGSWKELEELEQSGPCDSPYIEEKLLKLESKLSKMESTEEEGNRSRASAGKATEPGNLRK